MLTKIYLGVGAFLCFGLGVAYAMDWKAPDMGMSGGGSGGGRSFFSIRPVADSASENNCPAADLTRSASQTD